VDTEDARQIHQECLQDLMPIVSTAKRKPLAAGGAYKSLLASP
jgi:hypothetical protein